MRIQTLAERRQTQIERKKALDIRPLKHKNVRDLGIMSQLIKQSLVAKTADDKSQVGHAGNVRHQLINHVLGFR